MAAFRAVPPTCTSGGTRIVSRLGRFLATTIGQKVLMGCTGLLLIAFLVVHMAGNLLVFVGPDTYNAYSEHLTSNPLLPVAELVLLALFLFHLVSGIRVVLRNRAARGPVGYVRKDWAGPPSHKTWASTTMIVSGLLVLIFVPLHIATFKYGAYYASAADPAVRDLFRLVAEDFQRPLLVAWYVVAMVVIGFHLWHGFGSGFESLGVRYRVGLRRAGHVLALVIAGGFVLVPIALFFSGGRP
jgi:succinate dehydrogenase / fumarate reductase cytochrome b subunit